MASRLVLLPLFLLAVGCSGSPRLGPASGDGGIERLQAGDYDIEVTHQGRTRSYLVHVPARVGHVDPVPVLLAFHGGGGNPRQFKRSAGIDAVAEREGFAVVYPAGTGVGRFLLTWNAGTDCCGRARTIGSDDVGFTRAVIADLARRVSIDRGRIYAIGHSNGAGMTYRLALEAPGLLAAIVPVAGASMGVSRADARPIPLLHIHSVDDPRALYEGGLGPPFPGTDHRVEHRSVPQELEFWRELNGCTGEARVQEERTGAASQRAERLTFGCNGDAPVEHWRLHAVGHGWPGATERPAERLVGPHTNVISAAEEAWAFVRRFRL